jgi:hypothetical protein
MRTTCFDHLILLIFITLTILGEGYKLRSSSLCSVLQPVLWKYKMHICREITNENLTTVLRVIAIYMLLYGSECWTLKERINETNGGHRNPFRQSVLRIQNDGS